MKTEQREQLVEAASAARANSYAPYSKYRVGAAIRTTRGHIVTGCNVENASYGLAICAERVALSSAVAADGTHPSGTVFFMVNKDIRTKVRRGQFQSVISALQNEGVDAQLATGVLPTNQHRVIGLMTGAANLNWESSGNLLVQGPFATT